MTRYSHEMGRIRMFGGQRKQDRTLLWPSRKAAGTAFITRFTFQRKKGEAHNVGDT